MKHFVALISVLCLVGGIHAAGTLVDNVAGNLTTGINTFNANVLAFNAAITAGNALIAKTFKNYNTTLQNNMTAVMKRFENYTILSMSGALAYMGLLNNSGVADLTTDPILMNLNSTVQAQVQSIATALTTAALNITSQVNSSNAFSAKCLVKYGPQLTQKPILVSRFGECFTNEISRLAIIAQNISAGMNATLGFAQTVFNLSNICTISTVAQLTRNSSSPFVQPQGRCLQTYLNEHPSVQYYVAEASRTPQVNLIGNKILRCATLVQYDIQDSIDRVQNLFGTCLKTGV